MTFNDTDHPRGHATNPGSFTEKTQGDPEIPALAAGASKRTPEQIADIVAKVKHPFDRIGGLYEMALKGARAGLDEAQTPEPDFAREGEPDKYRDLWNENMPRVSGCMYFSIPGEQPIHVDDDQARRILAMLSSESAS